ncbi:hypothetical protein [Microbacterium sp. LWH13-1.2]|uniref:hypothetical protein n=1 Tax=Microbacterium sp. LWH13-1.2 TaxID=3135260 RepID=UPI0031398977
MSDASVPEESPLIIGALIGEALLGAPVSIPITAAILLIITQVHIPRQNAKV